MQMLTTALFNNMNTNIVIYICVLATLICQKLVFVKLKLR